jgi:hypothetical protein
MNIVRRLRDLEIMAWESGQAETKVDAVLVVWDRAIYFYAEVCPNDEWGIRDLLLKMRERRLVKAFRAKRVASG